MLASPAGSWQPGIATFDCSVQVKRRPGSGGSNIELPLSACSTKLNSDVNVTLSPLGTRIPGITEWTSKRHDDWRSTPNQGSYCSRPSTSCSAGSTHRTSDAWRDRPSTESGGTPIQVESQPSLIHSNGSKSIFQPLELELYKESQTREAIFWFLVFMSGGILYILNRWFPCVVARGRFKRCSNEDAVRESTVGVLSVASRKTEVIQKQLIRLSRLELDPAQLAVAVPRWSVPVRLAGFSASNITVEACRCRQGAFECLVRVLYFDFHCRRYVLPVHCGAAGLSPKEQQFFPVKFDLESLSITEIRRIHSRGLGNSAILNSRRQLFGDCEILVPVRSPLELILDECLHPFYLFQVLSVALWFADHYFYYATAIVFLSVISLFLTIRETIQNNMNLHKMARFSCPVEILRRTQTNRYLQHSGSNSTNISALKMEDFELLACNSTQLLPGDLFVLHRNMRLPCDAILLCGTALVDESMLTGETKPIYKTALPHQGSETFSFDQHKVHILTGGSETRDVKPCPAAGAALCLVARMGFTTTQGEMMRSLLYPEGSTRLNFEHEAWKFVGFLGCLSCFTFSWTLYQGLVNGLQPWTVVLRALDTITIAVPPALPIIVSVGVICAAQALRKLHRTHCLLPSRINVAGRANVVVFDKTGTLTEDDEDLIGVSPTEKFRFKGGKCRKEETNAEYPLESTPATVASSCSAELVAALAACHNLSFADDELIGDPLDYQLFRFTGWELHGAQIKNAVSPEQACPPGWQCLPAKELPSQSAAASPSTMASPFTPALSEVPGGPAADKTIMITGELRELETTPLGELNPCAFVSVVPTCNEDLLSGSSCCEHCREWIQEGEELSEAQSRGHHIGTCWPNASGPGDQTSFDDSGDFPVELCELGRRGLRPVVSEVRRLRTPTIADAATVGVGFADESGVENLINSPPPAPRRTKSSPLDQGVELFQRQLQGSGMQSTRDSTSCSSGTGHFHNINSNGNTITSVVDQEQVIIKVFEFDTTLQRMSVVVKNFASGYLRGYCKGSPERVIEQCRVETLPPGIEEKIASYASQGLRILAIAGKRLDSGPGGCADPMRLLGDIRRTEIECDLEFMALLLFSNLLRADSGNVVQELQRAGCAVYVATGDGAATGAAVAVESNIIPSVATCLVSGTLVGDVVQWESRALMRPEKLGPNSELPLKTTGITSPETSPLCGITGTKFDRLNSDPTRVRNEAYNLQLQTIIAQRTTAEDPSIFGTDLRENYPGEPGRQASQIEKGDTKKQPDCSIKISTSLFKLFRDSDLQLENVALCITGEAFRKIVSAETSATQPDNASDESGSDKTLLCPPRLLVAVPADAHSWGSSENTWSSGMRSAGTNDRVAICCDDSGACNIDGALTPPAAERNGSRGLGDSRTADAPAGKRFGVLRRLFSRQTPVEVGTTKRTSTRLVSIPLLEFVLRHFHVFCRMSPDDKALLIRQLQGLRCKPIVGMCGDGANDCAALKAADVGVSLSSAEASVAAPFNCAATPKSVAALLGVLREGRGALACSVQSFQFAALYALIQLVSVALLSKFGTTLSDSQFLYMDLLVVPPITYLLSWSASNHLCRELPPESLLAPSIVVSILGQIGLQTLFQAVILFLVLPLAGVDFYTIFHINTEDSEEVRGYENTIVFLVTNVQTVSVAVVLALGTRPWKALSRNLAYLLIIQILAALCVALILNEAVYMIWLRDLLDLESLPLGFRTILLLFVLINVVASALFELLVVRKFLRGREVRRDVRQLKLRGTVVQLVGEVNLPRIGAVEGVA